MRDLWCEDNRTVGFALEPAELIYADMVYENLDLDWIDYFWPYLKPNGIFIIQTDYHSAAEVKVYVTTYHPATVFINWLIWKNEFGNFRKDRFRQCHDDILIFAKGKHYKWYPDRIQIPKATAKSKGLNPSGRQTKIATSVITDICLTTVSNERVKLDGKCVRWQKPLALMDRLLSPFTDKGDLVIDPFMGTGTTGEWCLRNGRNFIGIEKNPEIYELAKSRLEGVEFEMWSDSLEKGSYADHS